MRIILNINDEIDPLVATDLVNRVIKHGLVSVGTYGPQYCFYTMFTVTEDDNQVRIGVSCMKRKSGTFSFVVAKDKYK